MIEKIYFLTYEKIKNDSFDFDNFNIDMKLSDDGHLYHGVNDDEDNFTAQPELLNVIHFYITDGAFGPSGEYGISYMTKDINDLTSEKIKSDMKKMFILKVKEIELLELERLAEARRKILEDIEKIN